VKVVEHVCDAERNEVQEKNGIIPEGMMCEQITDYKYVYAWESDIVYNVGCELRYTQEALREL